MFYGVKHNSQTFYAFIKVDGGPVSLFFLFFFIDLVLQPTLSLNRFCYLGIPSIDGWTGVDL